MRRPLPPIKRWRHARRRSLSDADPTTCPLAGSEELEGWDTDIEEWMIGAPGGK